VVSYDISKTNTNLYDYYIILCFNEEPTNPGLSMWQLYVYSD
jgi:hypothetical protein